MLPDDLVGLKPEKARLISTPHLGKGALDTSFKSGLQLDSPASPHSALFLSHEGINLPLKLFWRNHRSAGNFGR